MIRPPIFVFDTVASDVAVFDTADAAAAFVEPPDVRDPGIEVLDARGSRLTPSLDVRRTILHDAGQPDPAALEHRLLTVFEKAGWPPPATDDWDLRRVAAALAEYAIAGTGLQDAG